MIAPFYDHAGIQLFVGNCYDLLSQLPQGDHVITDPPYAPETHAGARTASLDGVLLDHEFESADADWLSVVFERARPRRWLLSFIDWRHLYPLSQTPPEGLEFVRFGVWVKPNAAPQFTGDRPSQGWEAVGIWHNAETKKRWNGGGHHAAWIYNIEQGGHPTMKPLPLVQKLVRLFTDPGELVVDPFCGSGTVLRACKDLGRKCIGIEQNEDYARMAVKRLSQESFDFSEVEERP